jgi:hypothetical protein
MECGLAYVVVAYRAATLHRESENNNEAPKSKLSVRSHAKTTLSKIENN